MDSILTALSYLQFVVVEGLENWYAYYERRPWRAPVQWGQCRRI